MQHWWENYKDQLPTTTDEEKVRIEYLTGGVPLLLRPLLELCKVLGDGLAMPSKVSEQLNDEPHTLSDALDIRNDRQVEDEFLKASEISLVSVQLREFASRMYVELN